MSKEGNINNENTNEVPKSGATQHAPMTEGDIDLMRRSYAKLGVIWEPGPGEKVPPRDLAKARLIEEQEAKCIAEMVRLFVDNKVATELVLRSLVEMAARDCQSAHVAGRIWRQYCRETGTPYVEGRAADACPRSRMAASIRPSTNKESR